MWQKRAKASTRHSIIASSIVMIIFLCISAYQVSASTVHSIALIGNWNAYGLGVEIPTEPQWVSKAVIDAMNTWNQAQTWFNQKWFPTDRTYTLEENSEGPINVRFLEDRGAFLNYSEGGNVAAVTIFSGGKGPLYLTTFNSHVVYGAATIYFDMQSIERSSTPLQLLNALATHELGHALGLGHTPVPEDLMCGENVTCSPLGAQSVPSSLDLYALHSLVTGQSQTATLPSHIPYDQVPSNALPEFVGPIPVLFLPLVLVTILFRFRGR